MAKEVLEMEIKSNTKSVTKDMDKLADTTERAADENEALNKSTGVGVIGFGKLRTVVQALGTALKALGVGLLISAFVALQEAMNRNQKAIDFMNTALTTVSMAFNDLFKFLSNNIGTVIGYFKSIFEDPQQSLKDFATAVKENLIERFMSLLDVFGHLGSAMKKLFEGDFKGAIESVKDAGKESVDVFTGVNNSVDKATEVIKTATTAIVDYTKKTYEQAKAITETQKSAARAAVEFAKLNAQYLKDAEVQRQIRDDETKTFAERIKANKELDKILAEQQKAQKAQIQLQIDAAQAQFDINGSEENFIALQEQKVAMLELEETITGQLSEQKTNAVSLEKELLETQNQVRAEGMTGRERELEDLRIQYEEMLKMAEKSGEGTTAITKKYEKQKAQVVAAGVNEQLARYSALGGALQSLAGENKALSIGMAIMDTYAAANAVLKDPTLVGPARFIAASTAIITGLANVKKIMQTDVGSGGGGSAGGAGGAATPAPQMMSGAFELSGGIKPEPVKAFVVTDEMTNSQDQLANIRRRATI